MVHVNHMIHEKYRPYLKPLKRLLRDRYEMANFHQRDGAGVTDINFDAMFEYAEVIPIKHFIDGFLCGIEAKERETDI